MHIAGISCTAWATDRVEHAEDRRYRTSYCTYCTVHTSSVGRNAELPPQHVYIQYGHRYTGYAFVKLQHVCDRKTKGELLLDAEGLLLHTRASRRQNISYSITTTTTTTPCWSLYCCPSIDTHTLLYISYPWTPVINDAGPMMHHRRPLPWPFAQFVTLAAVGTQAGYLK